MTEGRNAAEGSPLADLRGRLAKAKASLYLDVAVPVLAPLHVRCRPVEMAEIKRTNARFAKYRGDDVDVVVNATILTIACVGIFDAPEDYVAGKDALPTLPEGSPRFDGLREAVGLDPEASPLEVCRALFVNDGDIMSAAFRLSEWSGYTTDEVDRDHAGN